MPSTKHPSLLALLHRLKGPPLACLVALGIANGAPVSATWVGVVTGYSPETARQALQRLKELELAEQRRHAWVLPDRLAAHPFALPQFKNARN